MNSLEIQTITNFFSTNYAGNVKISLFWSVLLLSSSSKLITTGVYNSGTVL